MPSPLDVAVRAASEASAILTARRGHVGQVVTKQNRTDLVTEADLAAESAIVAVIRSHFPTHTLISEEGAVGGADADHCWYVDPLDGTMNFVHGHPFFAVSIAYARDGQLVVGVIDAPALGEQFVVEQGGGAFLNGARLSVSPIDRLDDALLASGFAYDLGTRLSNGPVWQAFLGRAQGLRRDGSASLDMAYVAAGRFDGYWEHGPFPWDVAAGVLLVNEAGGRVSDYGGAPYQFASRRVLASNGLLHEAMVAVLREAGA